MTNLNLAFGWGPREKLYQNRFDYVFSLATSFQLVAPPALGMQVPLRALPETREWSTFHVLGQEFIRTPNGIQHEVPRARLIFGMDTLEISDADTVSVDGRMTLETDTPDRLSMQYRGALTLHGGTGVLCPGSPNQAGKSGVSGSVFIASKQDVVNPKYRWMVLNQLIGIGKFTAALAELTDLGQAWVFEFDYDLYVAS